MTVTDQCTNARADIERYAVLRKSETDARALRELHIKVREQCDALQGTVERLVVLTEQQIRVPVRLRTDRLLDGAVRLRDEVATTKKRPADAANFLRALKKLSEDALGALESALEAFIRESQTVDAASMRQLEQIPRFANQVQILRDLQRTTPGRAAQFSVPDLRVFLEKYARVRESLRDVEDLPTEVKAFLKEVDKGGARLELLTDAVREWLVMKGLIGNVRIVISSTSS